MQRRAGPAIGHVAARPPLGDRLRVDAVPAGQGPQALLAMLDRPTDRLRRAGTAVENPAHTASLDAGEKTLPSKPGTKHQAMKLGPQGYAACPVEAGAAPLPAVPRAQS